MCGQDVAEVGAVEDILEGREHTDPYWRSPCTWDEPRITTSQLDVLESGIACARQQCGASATALEGHERNNLRGLLPAGIEEYQPHPYRQRREEKLSSDR